MPNNKPVIIQSDAAMLLDVHDPAFEEARNDISIVGHEIAENGLPESLTPFTIGFTGYGNVSNGAQEIAALLPPEYRGVYALYDDNHG